MFYSWQLSASHVSNVITSWIKQGFLFTHNVKRKFRIVNSIYRIERKFPLVKRPIHPPTKQTSQTIVVKQHRDK